MRLNQCTAALGCAGLLLLPAAARAHVVSGARVFPVTLTFDDPGVNDEVSLPAFGYSRDGAEDGSGPSHEFDDGFEFDKTITPTTALILNDGYDVIQRDGARTQAGFETLSITGKWQAINDAPHELVVSLGVTREIGGSGTEHIGADRYGSTTPNLYAGKGLGDLPVPVLRPFALTGELSYTIADKGLKAITAADAGAAGGMVAGQFDTGSNNAWSGGLSLQYSVPYLQSQVHDYALPGLLANLVPVVELDWSSPASSPSREGTSWTVAPGLIYLAQWGEVGVEALLPLNRTAGTTVGAVALVHLFLDDLLPGSLGRPLLP